MIKFIGSVEVFFSGNVAVIRLGKGVLRMSISTMDTMSEGQVYIGPHRFVMPVPVSGMLVKPPTVCNVVSRNTHFWIHSNLQKI